MNVTLSTGRDTSPSTTMSTARRRSAVQKLLTTSSDVLPQSCSLSVAPVAWLAERIVMSPFTVGCIA